MDGHLIFKTKSDLIPWILEFLSYGIVCAILRWRMDASFAWHDMDDELNIGGETHPLCLYLLCSYRWIIDGT